MKAAVVVFPGSNGDHDMLHALQCMQLKSEFVWHQTVDLDSYDLIALPGGFSYGDYLRCGAIARFSPIMKAVVAAAGKGKTIIGICNGFQVLVEAGLLPGALLRNRQLRFICQQVYLRTENHQTRFTRTIAPGEVLRVPIAHGEGRYYADPAILETLEAQQRIVFRYCDAQGQIRPEVNPNGSLNNIAGIINEGGNVLGMMPHPERAMEVLLGSADGKQLFESIIQ